MGRITKLPEEGLVGFGAEIFIVLENQIVLKQNPVNRITPQITKQSFKPFQNIGPEKVESSGHFQLFCFEVIALTMEFRMPVITICRIAGRHPGKEIEPVPMGDRCHFSQEIIHHRSMFRFEIDAFLILGVSKFVDPVTLVLKDAKDQCIHARFLKASYTFFHLFQVLSLEIEDLGADSPFNPVRVQKRSLKK